MKSKEIAVLQKMSSELIASLPGEILTNGNGSFFNDKGKDVIPASFVGEFNRLQEGMLGINHLIQEMKAVKRKSSE